MRRNWWAERAAVRTLRRVRRLAGHGAIALLLAVSVSACGSQAGGNGSGSRAGANSASGGNEVNLDPAAIAKDRSKLTKNSAKSGGGSHAQVVVAVPPGMASQPESLQPTRRSQINRAKEDAQIRKDLAEFRKYLATIPPASGQRAEVTPQGQAAVPFTAPTVVATVVQAANEIAKTPYRWGGGHGAWQDKGYDCSGSVSFALAAAGLLSGPLTSGQFMSWGAPGRGQWITLWANSGHIFMEVAGIRYDTSGLRSGSRWQPTMRPTAGFTPRHPPGL
jgi:cell wall-associated NlpC family hydrolase